MPNCKKLSVALITIVGSSVMTGCIQTPPIPVNLPSSIGGFQVQADEPSVNNGSSTTSRRACSG